MRPPAIINARTSSRVSGQRLGLQAQGSAEPLDHGRRRHAAGAANRLQAAARAAPFQFVQQRGHDARAAGAEWVTEGDRAAVDVEFFGGHAELFQSHQRHRRERFVDFEQVDVGKRQAAFAEHLVGASIGPVSISVGSERWANYGPDLSAARVAMRRPSMCRPFGRCAASGPCAQSRRGQVARSSRSESASRRSARGRA